MKDYNKIELKGRLFSYALEEKEDTEKGTPIAGTVTLEVDEDGTQVEVRFYAYPKYNNGNPNRTYGILSDILAGNYLTVVDNGDEAEWLSIDANISVDYYIGRDGAKDIDEMSRSQKIRGSFINQNKKHEYFNKWSCDMVVTQVEDVEENVEKGYPHKVRVHGYMLDSYNKRAMGVRFEAMDEAPMAYLLSLTPSRDNPFYTQVRGQFRKVTSLKIIEGAFGEDEKVEYENLFWVLNWMPKNAYVFGEDLTLEEFEEFMKGLDEYKTEKFNKDKNKDDEGDDLVF